jgi:hypothetical protein
MVLTGQPQEETEEDSELKPKLSAKRMTYPFLVVLPEANIPLLEGSKSILEMKRRWKYGIYLSLRWETQSKERRRLFVDPKLGGTSNGFIAPDLIYRSNPY